MKIPLAALLVLAAGTAQATDGSPAKRWLDVSPAAATSAGRLLIAQAVGPAPKSSGEKKPAVKKQVGGKGDDAFNGTKGPDLMIGGPGKDQFSFEYRPFFQSSTLDDGDRIADYEFGETIIIQGVRLKDESIKIVYDANKKETRIEFDLPNKNGETDGKFEKAIILTGDKRGTLKIHIPCCISESTEIWIEKAAKPKTVKKKVKKKKQAKRRSPGPRIQQNRYPAEDPNAAGGGH